MRFYRGRRGDDTLVPAELTVELYRLIPHAEPALLPGADHAFPFRQADQFCQLTVNFLARHQIPIGAKEVPEQWKAF